MATLKDRIEDIAGSSTSLTSLSADALKSWIVEGTKDVVRKIMVINPQMTPLFTKQQDLTSDSGLNLDNSLGVLSIYTTGKNAEGVTEEAKALEINPQDIPLAKDPTSLKYRSIYNPGFYKLGNKLYVIPAGLSVNTGANDRRAIVNLICYGSVSNPNSDETIEDFPEAFTDSALTYAAIKLLQAKMGEVRERFTSTITSALDEISIGSFDAYTTQAGPSITPYSIPSMDTIADISMPGAPKLSPAPIMPVAPTIDYSTVDTVLNAIVMPGDITLPALTTPSDSAVGVNTAPTSIPVVLPDKPDVTYTFTDSIPSGTSNAISDFTLEELPPVLENKPEIEAMTILGTVLAQLAEPADLAYTSIGSEPSDPSAPNFPTVPGIPGLAAMPEFPSLTADYGDISQTITPQDFQAPALSTVDTSGMPTDITGNLDTDFSPEWISQTGWLGSNYADWGKQVSGGSNDQLFEKAMEDEDPEMADMRLKQMQVEIQKFQTKNTTLAEVYKTSMQGYVEKIRAQVAKLEGEAGAAQADADLKTALVQAEAAIVSGQAAIIQGKISADKAKIDGYTAEVQGKVQAFAEEANALTQVYVGTVQGLVQQYQTESQHLIAKWDTVAKAQVQLYSANMQKFYKNWESTISQYSAESSYVINKYRAEADIVVAMWNSEMEKRIAKFSAVAGAAIQEKQNDIAVKTGNENRLMQRYAAELQKNAKLIESKLAAWNAEMSMAVQKYGTEEALEFQKWQAKEGLDVQAYNAKVTGATSLYNAQVGALIQKHQQEIGKASGIPQIEVAQFGAKLQKANAQVQSDVTIWGQKLQFEITAWSGENQNNLQEWNINVQKVIGEWQTKIQQAIAKFNTEASVTLQNWQGTNTLELQKWKEKFQTDVAGWRQEQMNILQKGQLEITQRVQKWMSDNRNETLKFQSELQRLNAEYQQIIGQVQLLQVQYEKGFVPFQMQPKQGGTA